MLSVRDARPEDAAEVAVVHVRAWQSAYRGLLDDGFLDGLRAEDRAARYAFAPGDSDAPRTLVAVEDGAIHGFASFGRSRESETRAAGELHALYVDPPRWRTGVGRELIKEVYARFAALPVAYGVLWVLRGNDAAAAFYDAEGWRPDGTTRHEDLWGVRAEVVRYRRELGEFAG